MKEKIKWVVSAILIGGLFWFFLNQQQDTPTPLEEDIQREQILTTFSEQSTDDLTDILQRKILRALVPYERSNFTILANGQVAGLQVELLKQYENMLNQGIRREVDKVKIIWIPTPFNRLISDLIAGKGDIVAAFLTVTPERQEKVAFATGSGLRADELVVTHSSITDIHRLQDLSGRTVYVLAGSSYEEHLHELNQTWEQQDIPQITIKAVAQHLYTEDVLKMVQSGMLPITVTDDYKAKLWAKVLKHIRVLDDVKVHSNSVIGWAVRKQNPELLHSLKTFSTSVKKGTLMGNMMFKRFINEDWIQRSFAQDTQSNIRKMLPVFTKYAEQYDYDVLAALAQAYQESHLDQSKRSHRGAVGVMQLLPSTAAGKHVGIPDISTLENNVHAGIKYVIFLRNRYFTNDNITALDQLLFSWAAYNAGPAKVIKMRKMATAMGLDTNRWFDHVELAAAKIVGKETVQYVRNIYALYMTYQLLGDRLLSKPTQDQDPDIL